LGYNQIDNRPQENLAKFDYKTNMKVKKKLRTLLYFDYLLEPVAEIWQFFFNKNPLHESKSYVLS